MAAMCGADRQFGAFRPSGVETARDVHPEGFGPRRPKPEAEYLSLCRSLGRCDSEYRGTRDDPDSMAGFGGYVAFSQT